MDDESLLESCFLPIDEAKACRAVIQNTIRIRIEWTYGLDANGLRNENEPE